MTWVKHRWLVSLQNNVETCSRYEQTLVGTHVTSAGSSINEQKESDTSSVSVDEMMAFPIIWFIRLKPKRQQTGRLATVSKDWIRWSGFVQSTVKRKTNPMFVFKEFSCALFVQGSWRDGRCLENFRLSGLFCLFTQPCLLQDKVLKIVFSNCGCMFFITGRH